MSSGANKKAKDVKSEAPKPVKDMFSFSFALDLLKHGRKLYRKAWGKGEVFIKIHCPNSRQEMTIPYLYIQEPPRKKGGKDPLVPWVANQVDLLSEDWVLVDGD